MTVSALTYLLVMVTEALTDLVGSALLTTLTVTTAGDGTDLGDAKSPLEPIRPTVLLPPAIPLTFQVTEVFTVLRTVAVNCLLPVTRTRALVGEIATLIGAGFTTVTNELPTAEVIAWLVACTVT